MSTTNELPTLLKKAKVLITAIRNAAVLNLGHSIGYQRNIPDLDDLYCLIVQANQIIDEEEEVSQ